MKHKKPSKKFLVSQKSLRGFLGQKKFIKRIFEFHKTKEVVL